MESKTFIRRGATLAVVGLLVGAMAVPVYAAEPSAEQDSGAGQLIRKEDKKTSESAPIPEQPPEQEEGAGRLTRKETDPPYAHLCAGCMAPLFQEGAKGSITPYGRVELDAIYSNGQTNPLDPSQFNGYATAAGSNSTSSSTLNPRYSVFGIRADRTDGKHTLTGVVEVDFYGQTDNAGNLPPRLRLANASYKYAHTQTSSTTFTFGMDWTPVMSLHPDLIDFSIMGYNGNLWQRLPQVTLRHKFTENFEGLITAFRFERGLSACCGQTQVVVPTTPVVGGGPTSVSAANDPVQNPYYGTRFAWNGSGKTQGVLLAASAAYRYYRSAPTPFNALFQSGQDINSYVVGGEIVVPLGRMFKFSGEMAYGQALGVEWFRFNQELNLVRGNPVRTFTGWGQLSFAPRKDWTFLAGYGWDNPNNNDLAGQNTATTFGTNNNIQYQLNHRTYLTAVKQVWSDFYTGFEWNHLMTEWVSGQHNQRDNYMLSFWYNF